MTLFSHGILSNVLVTTYSQGMKSNYVHYMILVVAYNFFLGNEDDERLELFVRGCISSVTCQGFACAHITMLADLHGMNTCHLAFWPDLSWEE